jgi:hypothetical protein
MATIPPVIPQLVVVPPGYSPLNQAGMSLANLAAWHLQTIGNSGILAAVPEPANAAPLGTSANPIGVFERAWIEEPPGSVSFDEQGAANFVPGDVDLPIVSIRVPQGFDGVIDWISNNIVTATPPFVPFSGEVIWKILLNGKPVRNFGNVLTEKGTIEQGRQVSPIRIFSGDLLQYTVSSPDVTSGTTIASLTGYYYPSKGVS